MRFALAAVAFAAALYLFPASVQIVAWPAGGPVRIALLPPLSRAWWSLLAGVTLVGALAVTVRRSPEQFEQWSRAVLAGGDAAGVADSFSAVVARSSAASADAGGTASVGGCGSRRRLDAVPSDADTDVVTRRRCRGGPYSSSACCCTSTLGLRFAGAAGFGGDEPHYLVITHSLLADHDLDIANNHEHRDYKAFYPGELRPDYLQRSQSGQIYSIHAPGLPLVLVPAVRRRRGVGRGRRDCAAGGADGAGDLRSGSEPDECPNGDDGVVRDLSYGAVGPTRLVDLPGAAGGVDRGVVGALALAR